VRIFKTESTEKVVSVERISEEGAEEAGEGEGDAASDA
jgi:hypothetical protein